MRIEFAKLPRQALKNLLNQSPDRPKRMITSNPVLGINAREKLLRNFRSTAHRKSLRIASQTESHHNNKIDGFFSSLLRKSANLPALVATKFPEPYEKLNPSIKINVRPYGNVKTRDSVELATLLTAGLSKAFADFQVISLPTAVSVGGKPSGFVNIRYTLKTADASFPTESSLWVVPTEHYFLMIGVGYSADEAKEIKPEIATSMKSIEFTD